MDKVQKNRFGWGMLIFMYFKLIIGTLIFFTASTFVDQSPYKEIASLLGIIVALTSGIRITLSNVFKDWTNQE